MLVRATSCGAGNVRLAAGCAELAMSSQVSSANDMRLARCEAVHSNMRHESPFFVEDGDEVNVTNM